ncbi:5-methylcytosine restriction system specificity protein McrC [Psychrobacter sp. GW64-MNA-CIBAN-0177]|uniref:McrC family protein n=1 Tax=Psychrobacter sp. GW64-MNA-CIBAN-0177 TaxID=3140449 RepID=UPI00331EE332
MTSRVIQSESKAIGSNANSIDIANSARIKALDANIMTVFEHQRLMAHDFLQASDFHWLMAQEFAVFTIKRKQGQWQLKVGHYIGIVLLPSGMTLEILPKLIASASTSRPQQQSFEPHQNSDSDIGQIRQWVQNMLSDLINSSNQRNGKSANTKSLGQFNSQVTPLPLAAPSLSDWLARQFLQRLAHYQPTQHYQAQVDNQATLQGRLLIKEQLRRNSVQPHKFVCERSVLSQDMLSNRLIKSALVWLAPLLQTAMPPKSIQLWQQVRALNYHERQRLESVYQQAKRQLALQPLSQLQAQAAQQLLELAYWLLQRSDIQTGNGIAASLSSQPLSRPRLCLLMDMNQAFEQWASLRIASMFEQLNKNYQALHQAQSVWLNDAEGQTCLSIRPDLLIYQTPNDDIREEKNARKHPYDDNQSMASAKETRNYSHVIDIKWKHLSHSGALSASDAYQLTSYAQAYQAGQVWLVYPVQGNVRQPVALRQQIHGSGNADSHNSASAKLWLMPFDVLSGTLNGELPQEL